MTEQIGSRRVEASSPTVHKGPLEGILIVDGRPQTECLDMPTISFESILALQRFKEQYLDKKDGD